MIVTTRNTCTHEVTRLDIGERVRLLREQRGWTKGQLAIYADLSRGYISRLEAGEYVNPSRKTIEGLARALRVSADYLLETAEIEPTGTITREAIREAIVRALGNQVMLSEQAIDRIVTEIMRQEIKRASERPRD